MTEKHFISVFRSSKSSETYVYVRRGQVWTELPETLRTVFGKPVHAMDLIMTTERKLARLTGQQVLEAIADKGFFLQMPDKLDGHLVEFGQKLRAQSE
ncbi:MAG: YcgL domain-containing protein [Oleiphilaceae bacterium]|nr:YcgL domain-containing protein [Oleiphilaceae bacterium]